MIRIGGVDAAGQRLRNAIEHLAAEAAGHERCEALVAALLAARHEWLHRDSELGGG